jgi:hypothetical protein
MNITIEINTSGCAFNQPDFSGEVLRVAERAACDALRMAEASALDSESVLFDTNGNRCGFAKVEFTESEWEAESMSDKLARLSASEQEARQPDTLKPYNVKYLDDANASATFRHFDEACANFAKRARYPSNHAPSFAAIDLPNGERFEIIRTDPARNPKLKAPDKISVCDLADSISRLEALGHRGEK